MKVRAMSNKFIRTTEDQHYIESIASGRFVKTASQKRFDNRIIIKELSERCLCP